MSAVEVMAADAQAPKLNQATRNHIANLAILATSSVVADLSAAAQLGDDLTGFYWTFQADGGDVYFALNNVSGGSVAIAATTGVTRCAKLLDGATRDMRIDADFTHLVAIGSVACNLRIYRSSK